MSSLVRWRKSRLLPQGVARKMCRLLPWMSGGLLLKGLLMSSRLCWAVRMPLMSFREVGLMWLCLLGSKGLARPQLVRSLLISIWKGDGVLAWSARILLELEPLNSWRWMLRRLNVLFLVINMKKTRSRLLNKESLFSGNRNMK